MREKIRHILDQIAPNGIPYRVLVAEKKEFGHYSTNLALVAAKLRKKKPMDAAQEFVREISKKSPDGFFEKVDVAAPGFINFWMTPRALQQELSALLKEKKYGAHAIGKGKTVVIDYSSPNIAKPMHVGHLRSTIIGDAIGNVYEYLGYTVVRSNYLGDWGTQFGKLIAAYKLWGKKEDVEKDPIGTLLNLYIKFHGEEKKNSELEKRGQEEFKKLEEGDKENKKLWEWFKKESLREFEKIYRLLGVTFTEATGESAYEKDLKEIVSDLRARGIAKISEGAIVVPLDEFKLPPALVQKSDEASLYLTRDLAVLRSRVAKYNPEKILYVVANQQTLHFEQLFATAKLLKWKVPELMHVKFGLVLGEDRKKLATREGKIIPLKELMEKIIGLALKVVAEKRPELSESVRREIAEAVGIGALKYNDLKENRNSDVAFDWEKMLDFSGNSAPYLLYAYARLSGILRKAGKTGKADFSLLAGEFELSLARHLFEFPEIVKDAADVCLTNGIAQYLYELANAANRWYETTPILKDENVPRRNARLELVRAACMVLERGLSLLGIRTPKEI